jgi:putative glutamine amidotransferase
MPGTSRPCIGLTAWRRQLPTALGERTDLYTLATEYVQSIAEAGGLPLIIPHDSDPEPYLDVIHGLLVTGGGDIDAATYGAGDQGTSCDVDHEADDWELKLIRAAQFRRLPVLGICRGMQIMAVASGGKLNQDISGAPGHPRMDSLGPVGVLAARHPVEITPGSTLACVYGVGVREVNTIHHQAVTDAGDFEVAARNEAGYIEAIEMPKRWPALAVQWHPEKMQTPQESAMEHRLFRDFISKAEAYARTQALLAKGTL